MNQIIIRLSSYVIKLTVIVIMIVNAVDVSAAPASTVEFEKWLTFYYAHKDPTSVISSMEYAVESGVLDDIRRSGPPIFGFIAGVVKDNPYLADLMVKKFDSIEDEKYALFLIGIWYANLPGGKSRLLIANALKRHPNIESKYSFLHDPSVDLLVVSPQKGPWVLDALWGNFMATGKSQPVINIISVLPWIDESKKQEILAMGKPGLYLMTTSGAANWSLISNAKQHKRVLEICEDQIHKQPEPISTQLRAIVTKAKG